MTLKNLFKATFLLCFLFSSTVMMAQQKSADERAKNQTAWMQKNLGLSQELNQKAYAINLTHAQDVDKIKAKGGDDAQKELIKANVKRNTGLKAIFTPDQFHKYQMHEKEINQKK